MEKQPRKRIPFRKREDLSDNFHAQTRRHGTGHPDSKNKKKFSPRDKRKVFGDEAGNNRDDRSKDFHPSGRKSFPVNPEKLSGRPGQERPDRFTRKRERNHKRPDEFSSYPEKNSRPDSKRTNFRETEKRGYRERRDNYPEEFKRNFRYSSFKGRKPTFKDRHESPSPGSDFPMPLNKYMAHCGICSRRKAVDYIKAGEVAVNNQVVTEPGFKVGLKDRVVFEKKVLEVQNTLEYILLNKPKDCLTTTKDPRGRITVMDLIRQATDQRVYPVGRLDRNTSGLLLITNDGDLAQRLSHPSGNVKKVYQVGLDKPLTAADFEKIMAGIELEDGPMKADALAYVDVADKSLIGIEIHSGKNRIVRRIFEHLDYRVKHLDRVLYAGLTKKNIPRGKWRKLSEKEVNKLKHFTLGKKIKKFKGAQ